MKVQNFENTKENRRESTLTNHISTPYCRDFQDISQNTAAKHAYPKPCGNLKRVVWH